MFLKFLVKGTHRLGTVILLVKRAYKWLYYFYILPVNNKFIYKAKIIYYIVYIINDILNIDNNLLHHHFLLAILPFFYCSAINLAIYSAKAGLYFFNWSTNLACLLESPMLGFGIV